MNARLLILATFALLAPQLAVEAVAAPTPIPHQLVSFDDLHRAVDAGLLQWKDCKPGPTGHLIVSVANYERYINHTAVPLPRNQMIDYEQALKYGVRDHKCASTK